MSESRRGARLPAVGGVAQLGGHLEARPAEHAVLGEQVQPARRCPTLTAQSLSQAAVALCVILRDGYMSKVPTTAVIQLCMPHILL